MLKILLQIISVFLLAAFVVAFPVSLIAHDIGALLFDPRTTKTLVREELLNAKLIAQVAQQAIQGMLIGGSAEEADPQQKAMNAILVNLSDEDWQKILDLTAPTRLIDDTINQIVDSYTTWLNSDEPIPPLNLDLKAWKENTKNNAGQVMVILLDSLPECNQDQMQAFSEENLNGDAGIAGALHACRPPEPYYSQLIQNSGRFVQQSLVLTPDVIDLKLMSQGTETSTALAQFKSSLIRVRAAVTWGWVVVAAVGALAVAMAQRGFASALRWAGWPLLLSGSPILVLALGLQFFSLHFLGQFLAGALKDQSGAIGIMGSALAGGILDLINKSLFLQGGLAAGLGIGALLYARVLRGRPTSMAIPISQRRIGL